MVRRWHGFFTNSFIIIVAIIAMIFIMTSTLLSCKSANKKELLLRKEQLQLLTLSRDGTKSRASQFAITSKIAQNYIILNEEDDAIIYLTDYVAQHSNDEFNGYYLLMVAFAYMRQGASLLAEYYFDNVLKNYEDLLVKGQSIHLVSLKNLAEISTSSDARIKYFNMLLERFPDKVSTTELYLRRAVEYEKLNEWDKALDSYSTFLKQPDSASVQYVDDPNAYKRARQLVGYSRSKRDWTFSTLEELESAVRTAIRKYDWRSLDRYKAKVNFFSMSWKQDEIDPNSQEEFSMRSFMRGNLIHCDNKIELGASASEGYLRTWGWSQYVSVWYLYFRKVNYPIDPEINGNWEWAGIYMGERL